MRYIAHGYPVSTLSTLQDVAGLTVPNYLTGLGAALISTTLESGSARVLAIVAPYQTPQPHGLYHGPGLAQADSRWISTKQRSPPPFGPEQQRAIGSALHLVAPQVLTHLGELAQWSQERWTQVRTPSSTAASTPASPALPQVSSQHALGDGNLYL